MPHLPLLLPPRISIRSDSSLATQAEVQFEKFRVLFRELCEQLGCKHEELASGHAHAHTDLQLPGDDHKCIQGSLLSENGTVLYDQKCIRSSLPSESGTVLSDKSRQSGGRKMLSSLIDALPESLENEREVPPVAVKQQAVALQRHVSWKEHASDECLDLSPAPSSDIATSSSQTDTPMVVDRVSKSARLRGPGSLRQSTRLGSDGEFLGTIDLATDSIDVDITGTRSNSSWSLPAAFHVGDRWLPTLQSGNDVTTSVIPSAPVNSYITTGSRSWYPEISVESSHEMSRSLRRRKYMPRYLIKPDKPLRLSWDVLGVIFMVYDLIWIPLLMCNVPESDVSRILAWVLRIYWSLDIPLNFMTGFINANGVLILNSRIVVARYCRTWFVFDVFLVVIDWVELIFTNTLGALRGARFGKVPRLIRVIRVVRLARLAKLPGILNKLLERSFSESTVMLMSITKIILLFLGFNHIVACVWFKLASDQYKIMANWLEGHGYDNQITVVTYSVSMHWAITCFIGDMDVSAHSLWERIFSIVVLIVSFVASASFVSAITTSVTRLQIINGEEQTHFSLLSTFLRAQGINSKLAMRITKSASQNLKFKKNQVGEEDVELLKVVPNPLMVEMHYQINSRVLRFHVLFDLYCCLHPMAMQRVCHEAISSISVTLREVLFRTGAQPDPPCMLFLTHGALGYFKDSIGMVSKDFEPVEHGYVDSHGMQVGQFACEANLWLRNWMHMGRLVANVDSTILRLHAEPFQKIMTEEFHASDEDHPAWYAVWFAESISELERKRMSDVDMGLDLSMVIERLQEVQAKNRHAKTARFRGSFMANNIDVPLSFSFKQMAA